jgi:hypothetical protein
LSIDDFRLLIARFTLEDSGLLALITRLESEIWNLESEIWFASRLAAIGRVLGPEAGEGGGNSLM